MRARLVLLFVIAACDRSPRAPATAAVADVPGVTLSSLAGVVRDAETGRRLDGVSVVAMRGALASPTATTDAAGRFRIADLPPGEYAVRCDNAGVVTERQGVRVNGPRTTHIGLYIAGRDGSVGRSRRIRMFLGDDIDRANCCVDQSPHQLRGGGRRPGPRPRR